MRICVSSVFKISLALMLLCLLGAAARVEAQIVPCSPGGPPPGSVPRAIAKAPQFTIPPSLIPVPGRYLWVLYENSYLTLLLLPENWPASPAIQVTTLNLGVPSGFGIPPNYELYDVATGRGNFGGFGEYFTMAWVAGRDPATGQHRAQMVGISAGGGCSTFGWPVYSLNLAPAAVGSVDLPDNDYYLITHFWQLEQNGPTVEPGASTPDQTLALRHLPTGTAIFPPVDEDQILCAPGVNCPNWGDTLIQQITGQAVHALLRNQITGAQSIGWLNLGNSGFGGINGCAGSVNPCLYQRANLPAPISGSVIDVAGDPFIPDRVWVLWAEGIAPASAPLQNDDGAGPPAASFEKLASASSTVTYKLGELNGNGALLGSMTIAISGGGVAPALEVSPASIDFGAVDLDMPVERTITIRNEGQTDLTLNSIAFTDPSRAPYSFCEPIKIPYFLRPQESVGVKVCFQPQMEGVFQNAVVIQGSNPNQVTATVPLSGRVQTAERQPDIEVNPTHIDFGLVNTGASAERSLIIRNTGQTDLTIETATITVSETIWYVDTDITPPRRLMPAEAAELRVRFGPPEPGVFQNSITIRSNDPDEGTVIIPLSGRAQTVGEQLSATLNIDRGCGAIYRIGDPLTINFQTSRDAFATLKVILPDGAERTLFAGQSRGGVTNILRGTVGEPVGERLLILEAVADELRGLAQCSFTGARGGAPPLEAHITTNKGRLEPLVEPGEDPAPKPVFLPDERVQVLLRFNSPRPLRGLARVEWEQGGQRATVFRGLITSNTDAGFTLLPPFNEREVGSIPAANLILRITGTDAANPFDLTDTCGIEIFYGHTLEIKKVTGAGGANGTKWNDLTRSGKVGSNYTFTVTVEHKVTDAHAGDGHVISYTFDWDDDSPSAGPQADKNTATHAWLKPGTYFVRITATDPNHKLKDTRTIKVVIRPLDAADHKLEIKKVTGAGGAGATAWQDLRTTARGADQSGQGRAGVAYTFTADIEHEAKDEHAPTASHGVNYNFDWGDGTSSGNQAANAAAHTWTGPGVYIVRVIAEDPPQAHAGLMSVRIIRVFIENAIADAGEPWVDGYVVPGGEITLVGSSFAVGGNQRHDTVRVEAGLEWHNVKNQELDVTVTITYCNNATASQTVTRRLGSEGLHQITVVVNSTVPIAVKVRSIEVNVTGRAQQMDEASTPVNDSNPRNGINRREFNCP